MKSSLANVGKIAAHEWDARFRSNLIQLCWQPERPAGEVQLAISLWERRLVEVVHHWRHPALWTCIIIWKRRTWKRAQLMGLKASAVRRALSDEVPMAFQRWWASSRTSRIRASIQRWQLHDALISWQTEAHSCLQLSILVSNLPPAEAHALHRAWCTMLDAVDRDHRILHAVAAIRTRGKRRALYQWMRWCAREIHSVVLTRFSDAGRQASLLRGFLSWFE